MATIRLSVNGKALRIDTEPERPLLEVLREDLGLTGTKSSDMRQLGFSPSTLFRQAWPSTRRQRDPTSSTHPHQRTPYRCADLHRTISVEILHLDRSRRYKPSCSQSPSVNPRDTAYA